MSEGDRSEALATWADDSLRTLLDGNAQIQARFLIVQLGELVKPLDVDGVSQVMTAITSKVVINTLMGGAMPSPKNGTPPLDLSYQETAMMLECLGVSIKVHLAVGLDEKADRLLQLADKLKVRAELVGWKGPDDG